MILGKGYESADDFAALFASGFILYNCYLIFRPALAEIMDENLYEDLIADIRIHSLKVEGILDTEKCFVRKSGTKHLVDLHAIVNGDITVKEGHILAHNLQAYLQQEMPQLGNILIHVEPN